MKLVDTLVLSSGGTRGLSFIGALDYLNKFHDKFEENNITTYVGTSIGALICGLLYLGIKIDDLKKIAFDTEFVSFFSDIKILNFINTMGVINPDNIKNKIKEILKTKGVDTDITLKNLHNITKKELYLVSVDLITEKVVYISHHSFPDMMFIDAVLSSMSIPLVFPPVKYKNYCLVDGALLETICFNKDIFGELPLLIDIVREKRECVAGISDYILKIISTVINNRKNLVDTFQYYYTIKTNEKDVLDTKMDASKVESLIIEGYESIKSCIKVKHE